MDKEGRMMGLVTKIAIALGGLVIVSSMLSSDKKKTVVVLGNSDPVRAMKRVRAALWVCDNYDVKRVIFAGHGDGIEGLTEAEWMADLFEQLGGSIPPEMETSSWSTKGNVELVSKRLGKRDELIVVSDHPHVISAAYCFEKAYGHKSHYVLWPTKKLMKPRDDISNCKRAGCCDEI